MGNSSSAGSSSDSSSSSSHHEESHSPTPRSPDTTTVEELASPDPFLHIVEQPCPKFRFRYKTEMHNGTILGRSSGNFKKKSYPSVQLCNYKSDPNDKDPIIRCTLSTASSKRVAHVHRLIGKSAEGEKGEPHDVVARAPDYIAEFQNMAISYTKKEHQEEVLIEKKKNRMEQNYINTGLRLKYISAHLNKLKEEARAELANMNLNVVCLKFEALIDKGNGQYTALCPPVYSSSISDMNNPRTNNLKICRVDKCMGCCKGGEVVFMFTEKIVKTNIRVKFFELNKNKAIVWTAYAEFKPEDVHRQYGIVFRTPRYRDLTITENKVVWYQLERRSDNAVSPPLRFEYMPDTNHLRNVNQKRPRADTGECDQSFNVTRVTPSLGSSSDPKVSSTVLQQPSSTSDDASLPYEQLMEMDIDFNIIPSENDDLLELILELEELNGRMEASDQNIPSSNWSEILDQLPDSGQEGPSIPSSAQEFLNTLHNSDLDIERIANGPDLVTDGPKSSFQAPATWKLFKYSEVLVLPKKHEISVGGAYGYPQMGEVQVVEPQMGAAYVEPESETITKAHHQMDVNIPESKTTTTAQHQMEMPNPYRGAKKATPMETLTDRMKSTSLNDTLQRSDQKKSSIISEMEAEEVPKKVEVLLSADNIVFKTGTTLNSLLVLLRRKQIPKEKFKMCLQHLFSCRVKETRDSVFHILAAKRTAVPQAKRFLGILKLFGLIGNVVNCKNNKEETPLLVAAQFGCVEMMSLLLESGANVNEVDADRNTAAHHIASKDHSHTEAMSVLIDSNIDLTKCNDDGLTALHLAVKKKNCDLIRCIGSKTKKSDEDSDHQYLINQQDLNFGNTALHFAVQYRSIESVNTLLDTFAGKIDVNLKNYDRFVPLAYVLWGSDPDSKYITEKLISVKADPDLVEKAAFYDETFKTDLPEEDKLEINDVSDYNSEVDYSESAYARQWENNELFDKETVSKLCPILDKENDWQDLAQKLSFSDMVIQSCKEHWSPTLYLFKFISEHRPDMTSETVRDELFAMPDRLKCCAQFIDDMLLRNLGVS